MNSVPRETSQSQGWSSFLTKEVDEEEKISYLDKFNSRLPIYDKIINYNFIEDQITRPDEEGIWNICGGTQNVYFKGVKITQQRVTFHDHQENNERFAKTREIT